MAVFDICIIALMLAMCGFTLRRNWSNPAALGRKARLLPLAGLGLIALFYATDLFAMTLLPGLVGSQRAMDFMIDLHLNWSWPMVLAAVSLIGVGYLCSVREASDAVTRLECAERAAQIARRRMEDFADSASDWFWEMDENLHYTWFSSAVEDVIKMPRESLYGKRREELSESYEPNALWQGQLERLRRREPFKDFVYPRQGPDGVRWIRSSGVPVFDGDGQFSGYRGTGSDITREVEAEVASNDAKSLLARAVEGLGEAFALWDSDDRLVLCNQKFRDINAAVKPAIEPGILHADHVRMMLEHGAYPDAVGREEAWYSERLDRYRNPRGPYELARQDGIWLLVNEQKLTDGSAATISLDITERKKAETAVQESEVLLTSIFENVPLGLLIKDTNHVIERVNGTYIRWYGIEPGGLIGKRSYTLDNFQSDEDAAIMRSQEAEIQATGQILTRQVERAFTDGKLHTVSITKFPIRNSNGKIEKIGSISVDLTEQVEAQKALAESERRFRDFTESASDWSWEMDEQLRFTNASDRYHEITGFDPTHYIGKTRREMTPEDVEDEKWRKHYSDLDNRRPFRDFRYDVIRADRIVVTISISGKPVFDDRGRFAGYRGTGSNITEQRRMERARDAALREALDANASKSKFLANMSHDLRTPLNAILGFSDILRSELIGPLGEAKYCEYAGDIHSSAAYLLELVNDLLDISTIEAGKKSLDCEELSVDEMIDDCVRTFAGKADSKKITLAKQVPENPLPLYADKRATRQILHNLLNNAVKFTPNGGTVTVLARAYEQRTEIVIQDTGSGISPDRLADVVNPFSRGEQNPYESDTGWGLGLSIVHSLVELHSGKMEIESELGRGTTVTVTFPQAQERPAALSVAE